MARLRFVVVALLALAFAGNSTQLGRTKEDPLVGARTTEPKLAADEPCVIYSLADMGYDAVLGSWIAETIPEMIEPSSWKNQGGMGAIRYYPPKNILIVKQTAAIQKKVDGFLKDLKSSMPTASAANAAGKKTPHTSVIPADHREPALLRTSTPTNEPSGYPVAPPVKAPKHLFHFIIRYEGDGIIDDNVVKFMKSQGMPLIRSVETPSCPAGAPPAVNNSPPSTSAPVYGAPTAVPSLSDTPSSYLTRPDGSPVPSATPAKPAPAPKKKKGKKGEHKEQPVPNISATR